MHNYMKLIADYGKIRPTAIYLLIILLCASFVLIQQSGWAKLKDPGLVRDQLVNQIHSINVTRAIAEMPHYSQLCEMDR